MLDAVVFWVTVGFFAAVAVAAGMALAVILWRLWNEPEG